VVFIDFARSGEKWDASEVSYGASDPTNQSHEVLSAAPTTDLRLSAPHLHITT